MTPKVVIYFYEGTKISFRIFRSLEGIKEILINDNLWPIFLDLSFKPLTADKVSNALENVPKIPYVSQALVFALEQSDCDYFSEKYINILAKKAHPILSYFGQSILNDDDLKNLDFVSLKDDAEKSIDNIIKEVFAVDLNNFEFSVRTTNVLSHARIKKIGELVEFSEAELMSMQNFGRKSLRELNKFIKEFGVSFKEQTYFDESKLNEFHTKLFGGAIEEASPEFNNKKVIPPKNLENYSNITKNITSPSKEIDKKQVVLLEKVIGVSAAQKTTSRQFEPIVKDLKEYKNIFENFIGALDHLDQRQNEILRKRIGLNSETKTLQELGDIYDITRERVRQLESAALKALNHKSRGWNPNNLWGDAIKNAFEKTLSPLSAHHLSVIDNRFNYKDYGEEALLTLLMSTFSKSMNLYVVEVNTHKYLARTKQQDIDNLKSGIVSLLPSLEGKPVKEIESFIRGITPVELSEFSHLLMSQALEFSIIQEIDGVDHLQAYSTRSTSSSIAKRIFLDAEKPLSNNEISQIIQEQYPGSEFRSVTNTFKDILEVFPFSHGTWGTIQMLDLTSFENTQIITLVKDFVGQLNKDQFHSVETLKFIEKHNRGLASLLDEYKMSGFIRYYDLAYPLGRNMFSQSSSEVSRVQIKDLVHDIFIEYKKPMKRSSLTRKVNEIRPVMAEINLDIAEFTSLGNGYYCPSSWITNVVHNGIYFQINNTQKEEFLDFSKDYSTNANTKEWTDKEIKTLLKLDNEGLSKTFIADEMGLSKYAVHNGLNKFRTNYVPSKKVDETQVQDTTNLEWTESRVNILKSLWEKGHSARKIAKKLGGTSRGAVLGKIRRLGIPKSVPNDEREENNLITNSISEKNLITHTYSEWSDAEKRKIKKLREFNYRAEVIAKILDKDVRDVEKQLNRILLDKL